MHRLKALRAQLVPALLMECATRLGVVDTFASDPPSAWYLPPRMENSLLPLRSSLFFEISSLFGLGETFTKVAASQRFLASEAGFDSSKQHYSL